MFHTTAIKRDPISPHPRIVILIFTMLDFLVQKYIFVQLCTKFSSVCNIIPSAQDLTSVYHFRFQNKCKFDFYYFYPLSCMFYFLNIFIFTMYYAFYTCFKIINPYVHSTYMKIIRELCSLRIYRIMLIIYV